MRPRGHLGIRADQESGPLFYVQLSVDVADRMRYASS